MQFRDKGPHATQLPGAFFPPPCAFRGCVRPAQVDARVHGALVHFCIPHFNAYGRGELEPIEEEAKQ